MNLTTYRIDYIPPSTRKEDESICYYLRKKGRKHFEMLRRRLPNIMTLEEHVAAGIKEAQQQHLLEPIVEEKVDENLEAKKFRQLLLRTEWTGISPMGRLMRPKLIPTSLTAAQEAALLRMYEETENCVATREKEAVVQKELNRKRNAHVLAEASNDDIDLEQQQEFEAANRAAEELKAQEAKAEYDLFYKKLEDKTKMCAFYC